MSRLRTPRVIARRRARNAAIRGALALRAPALVLLAERAPDARARAVLTGASSDAWQLFLVGECCAIPIARALRASGVWDSLPADARAAVSAAEGRETRRVLAAHAALHEVDVVATALGVSPIVLKGGATLAAGTAVDLGDLDLLLRADDAHVLAHALAGHGYREAAGTLVAAGRLPIELHASVPYAELGEAPPTVPLAGARALRRLVGPPAVLLLLRHGVVHHPFRRGHLRDLVVLAEALDRCTPADRAQVADLCAADPAGPELADTLRLAQAIRDGAPVIDPPAVRRAAAHKYLFVLGTWDRAARVAPRWSGLLCAALERPAMRYAPFWDALRCRAQRDPRWQVATLVRVAPRLASLVTTAARLPYRGALVAVALLAGPFARHRISRLAS